MMKKKKKKKMKEDEEGKEEEEEATPSALPISADRSLVRPLGLGFANNGAVARGAFFRWRLDTHRIYILLLLLGKRSSAERLFNTTRSLARPSGLFYDREEPASPLSDKSRALSSLRCRPRRGDKN